MLSLCIDSYVDRLQRSCPAVAQENPHKYSFSLLAAYRLLSRGELNVVKQGRFLIKYVSYFTRFSGGMAAFEGIVSKLQPCSATIPIHSTSKFSIDPLDLALKISTIALTFVAT